MCSVRVYMYERESVYGYIFMYVCIMMVCVCVVRECIYLALRGLHFSSSGLLFQSASVTHTHTLHYE